MATVEQAIPRSTTASRTRARRSRSRTRRPGRSSAPCPTSAPARSRELASAAARRSPRGRRYGFDGRARSPAARAEVADRQRTTASIDDDRLRDRQDLRGRRARRDLPTAPTRSGSGPSTRPSTWPTSASSPASSSSRARSCIVRYQPLGADRRDRPVELPADELLRRLHPGARGRQLRRSSSRREVTPLTSLLMAERLRECGLPEDVFQVATGRGETGAALVDEVDMIMFTGSTATGKKVAERGRRDADPGRRSSSAARTR